MSKSESIRRAYDEAERQAGVDCFDVIINNAGIGTDVKVLEVSESDYDKLMAVNTRGCWIVAQEGALANEGLLAHGKYHQYREYMDCASASPIVLIVQRKLLWCT